MRISELSQRSAVSVPTIKFYLRDGLLPAGMPTGRNQADYGEVHLRRLRLIRALIEVGGLGLSSVRELVALICDDQAGVRQTYRAMEQALYPCGTQTLGRKAIDVARVDAGALVAGIGWKLGGNEQGREVLAQVMASLRTLGCQADAGFFARFAQAAEDIAVAELDLLEQDPADQRNTSAIVRDVLLGVALAAMRRMAREHHVAQRFPEHYPDGDGTPRS